MSGKAKIGMVGLAVMGENLALNIERNGFPIAVYNRDPKKVDAFMQRAAGKNVIPTKTPQEFMASLERPRKAILLVKAGEAVDWTIDQLKPYMEPGDIIIDGGNSFFVDSERREKQLKSEGFAFIGSGVSGGEQGALWGPSLMPGGDKAAYESIRPIWEAIAAKVEDGPCVTFIGAGGSGHFVKMVHNGIEYGDMQLIAEAYDMMRNILGMSADEMADVFDEWNKGELKGHEPHSRGKRALQLGDQPRRGVAHLEGRMHHPRAVSRQDQAGVPAPARSAEPRARPRLQGVDREVAGQLAPCRCDRRTARRRSCGRWP